MAQVPAELYAHREWLGQLQQVGLVVSPQVLVDNGVFVDRQRSIVAQARLRVLMPDAEALREGPAAPVDFLALLRDVLEWPNGLLAGAPGGPALPEALTVALPEYSDTLSPSYAIADPSADGQWQGLVNLIPAETDFDKAPEDRGGWRATPHARLERLLRESGIPIGLLFNGAALRLVYAPRGESSGYLTFRFAHLVETLGRPMVGALCALLDVERVTSAFEQQRLLFLLRESRKYQNKVSTELAGQVLEALWELLRGLQQANEESKGVLLADVLREQPDDVYGGLLTTMMRLVFILYAEDRELMPSSDVYQRHYAVSGLFERLREDQARYPDTMDARFGAWTQLLVLFRLIHDGGGHGDLRFPSRHGRLFDPEVYPFLEGRPHGSRRQLGETVDPPKVSDGVVFRILDNLLILDGERLSYRTLDVEQIGSVYEAMMGFALRVAAGPSIAVTPKHVVVNLETLLEQNPKDRVGWLKEETELKMTGDALAKTQSASDVVVALGKRVSRYTPHALKLGDLFLQPTEERRRSGSHYTPRSLTQPIVQTTFRPIFERLGEQAAPDQILDLKVCDPAMGSGAFLVEACRLLAEQLVRAWEVHKCTPKVPNDEDVLTYARRLVAERCLYGVDKNVFAVDLAKLSLWLATLAREHPFTFLDHALRYGDSLVGLSREQIACLHWSPTKQLPLIRTFIDARVAEAQNLRREIQSMGASDDVPGKARLLRDADDAIADVRLIGDVVVSAFFEREKPRERETLRAAYAGRIEEILLKSEQTTGSTGAGARMELGDVQDSLRDGDRPLPAFHWEVEFPEVFTRDNGGFDALVGNPPFLGGNQISTVMGMPYFAWLVQSFVDAGGVCDLVAYFFRRVFQFQRLGGTFGLVATKTIGKGETRLGGLRWIRRHGGVISSATRRIPWPGAASVMVSLVHVLREKEMLFLPGELDGRVVSCISSYLVPGNMEDLPRTLAGQNELFSQGTNPRGMGFILADADPLCAPLSELASIRQNRAESQRVRLYLSGDEINGDPNQDSNRYIICVDDIQSEDELKKLPNLHRILSERVRPERETLGNNPNNLKLKRRWWAFHANRTEFYEALRRQDRCLVNTQVSNKVIFAFQPTDRVFALTLNMYLLDHDAQFAVLQSRVHEIWAFTFGSYMKDDLRYTPSTCFETFPFPKAVKENQGLTDAGRQYEEFRRRLMSDVIVRRQLMGGAESEGLTTTYNRFHDPEETLSGVLRLRALHDAMDRAVLEAYGWSDIQPTCEFILDYEDDEDEAPGQVSKKKRPWRYRWPDDVRDEVLGRLLELNAQRAKEEELTGRGASSVAPRKVSKRSKGADTPLLGG
jgi:hypothetical protein